MVFLHSLSPQCRIEQGRLAAPSVACGLRLHVPMSLKVILRVLASMYVCEMT